MAYKGLTALAIAKAQYQLSVERRCRLPGGAWVRGAGLNLHFELLENYQDMLDADPVAIDRYKTIAMLVPELPPDVVDRQRRHEIEVMLKRARKVGAEYYRKFDRDAQFTNFMRKAAVSIAKDLRKMRTTGA
jgi:hypothetical protein